MTPHKLIAGKPLWPSEHSARAKYPSLDADVTCEVAVVGGGFTGAMVSRFFALEGIDTVLLEKREIGAGSTSASTALLQYELDVHLIDLAQKIGEVDAARVYRLSFDALKELDAILGDAGAECAYRRKQSLYLASAPEDVAKLLKERDLRRKYGFEVEYLSAQALSRRYGIDRPGALLTPEAAEADPFLLTHLLVEQSAASGMRVFEGTAVVSIDPSETSVLLKTGSGHAVRARHVIFTAGYEAEEFFKASIVDLYTSYVAVTPPQAALPEWLHECMVWESARPYLYLRTTADGRLIIGGEDDRAHDLDVSEKKLPEKTKTLLGKAQALMPGSTLQIERSWAGVFGITKDSMPYIGSLRDLPRTYFALCYDGNGMTFSVIAGRILRDLIYGRPNADARLFRFDRPSS